LGPVLELLTEVVAAPALRDQDFDRLQRQRLQLLAQRACQPPQRAAEAFLGAAFPPRSRRAVPREGTVESVVATGAEDVRRWWRATASPPEATVVVVGDLADIDIEQVLADTIGAWTTDRIGGAREASDEGAVDDCRAPGRRLTVVDFPDAVQTSVVLGAVVPAAPPERRAALEAAVHYLGGAFLGSRLNTRIREELAASYGAAAGLEAEGRQWVLRLQAMVETPLTAAAVLVMAEEVDALREGSIDEAALRAATTNLARTSLMRFNHPAAVAAALQRVALDGLPDDYYEQVYRAQLAADPTDVVTAFADTLDDAVLCAGAAGAAGAVGPVLEAVGYEVTVKPAPR
jgi:predicted Zn-dependent peptidase